MFFAAYTAADRIRRE